MPLAREVASALNISVFEKSGFEADDIIATLARCAEKDGAEVVIVTADKDAYQLVNENISVFNEPKNTLFGPAQVLEKYGLPPSSLVDMFSMMGDASDNVPGIKGVGEKTAVRLLQKYGTLENLLKNAGEIEGKTGKLISSDGKDALMCKKLIALDDNVGLEQDWKSTAVRQPEQDKVIEFLNRFEFHSLLNEILPKNSQKSPGSPPGTVKISEHAALSELKKAKFFAFYSEESGQELFPGLTGLSAAFEGKGASRLNLESAGNRKAVKEALEDSASGKACHDLKREMKLLHQAGIEVKGRVFDTMIAAYCLNPARASYSLEDLALEYLSACLPGREENDPASAAWGISELSVKLGGELKSQALTGLFENVEMPLVGVLAKMENLGLKIDKPYFEVLSSKFAGMIDSTQKEIFALAGQEFNPGSPKQLSFILFEKLKLPVVKKTKTGYSTDEEVLKTLAPMHELPDKLLRFRELQKLKSTYIDPLLEIADTKTSRIHTTFNQTGTATGRLSSSEPNLQNIPIRSEYGREIRRGFIPEKGFTLFSADYSQIDLRVLAHMSGDKALIKAFLDNLDIHTATAMEVFGKTAAEVTPELRRVSKSINFGIVYGISPFGLAQQLGIGNNEAKDYIDRYFARYVGVREWIDGTLALARKEGRVRTLLGRVRYLPEINSKNGQIRGFAERMAMNTPIQGTSADIIKVAMINIHKRLEGAGSKSRMLVQVHDDLLFEIAAEDMKELPIVIKSDMEKAVELKVPVVVDVKSGANWSDMS
jgi:DNA polymerase I